jgi:histone deacetylase 11
MLSDKPKSRTGRWAKVAWVGLGLLCVLATHLLMSCIAPQSFRAAKTPRDGRAMNDRVAVVYSANYQIDLGGGERLHPFDIHKYAKIYLQLNLDGLLRPDDVFVPEEISTADLLRVHTPEYLDSLRSSTAVGRHLEAPFVAVLPAPVLDYGLLRPFRYATGGTVLAARLALARGIAVNLGGGYHHAKPASGGGFCLYADMPVAIRTLQAEGLIRRALVVDLDVHQGNGTAVCFAGDPSVFTFDMHQGNIYPFPKEQCSLDVELPAGMNDERYLKTLRDRLPAVLAEARPDIVFLQGGVDVLLGDPLAALAMSQEGVVARDATVIDACVQRKIPIVMVLGGGYCPEAWAAQYASIRRTILTYGLTHGQPYPSRAATVKERFYAK